MIDEERIWKRIKEVEDRMTKASYYSAYAVADKLERELERLHKLLLEGEKRE